jgi:hypothetical protein
MLARTLPLVFLLAVGCVSARPADSRTGDAAPEPAQKPEVPAQSAPSTADDGYLVLFDGSSTEGWVQAGPGRFVIENGTARSEGGMGLFYYSQKSFRDFTLELEFRQERPESNSGVFVRFPRVDGDPWLPVRDGYEIQIAGSEPAKNTTGSIYSFQAATQLPLKPAGEWNHYAITVIGQSYEVSLNGKVINRYTGERSLEGMVGLQNHGDADKVEFRNVRIRER